MREKKISIAIDGPSGAGKSTLSREVARRFGLIYVDTGAIYRTVGLAAKLADIGSKDFSGVAALLPELEISLCHDNQGRQRMYLNGRDVSDEIRLPEISIYASDVSAMPAVRAFLLEMQRRFARESDVIMDGRDIGTVVLPEAGLKIFLTASSEKRAERRFKELLDNGVIATYNEVLRDIIYRDKNDSSRAEAPLMAAPGAVTVDTTFLSFEESRERLFSLVAEKFEL